MKTFGIAVIFSTLLSLFWACNSNNLKKSKKLKSNDLTLNHSKILKIDSTSNNNILIENFDLFLKKFNSDSSFQVSRISFPLKITTNSEDGDTTRFMEASKWKFIQLISEKKEKTIIKKKQILRDKIDIIYMIEDTGVFVDHYFILNKGKWMLSFVTNASD